MSSFRPLTRCEAAWQPWDSAGMQRAALWSRGDAILMEGTAILAGEDGFAAWFRIACDEGWRVREADVSVAGGAGLSLRADGDGNWTDAQGLRLPAYAGCIDIDLQASPLTNILPIRRTNFRPGDMREFTMVYIPFPGLTPFVDEQRYTCLARDRYLYEAVDGTFSAELPVDGDGLVLDYPGLFRRIPA